MQVGSLVCDCLSSTCINFVLAEGIQSNMGMQNPEMNVAEEEKIHLDVAFLNFFSGDLILAWSHPTFSEAWLRTYPNYKTLDIEAAVYA